jgi:hypothetical protein
MKISMPPSLSLNKTTVLFLVILFLLSFTVIAFDYHNERFSYACATCHAKNSVNGTQYSFIVLFYPTIAHYKISDESFNIIIPVSIFREGRAPPESA